MEWHLGKADSVRGGSTAGWRGERAALRMAGVAWRLRSASGTRVSVGGCQGEGQVALEGFSGSIWPRARGGRSPPAAYGGRRENRAPGRERGEGEGLFGISEIPGTFR